jgi:serine/threonine protein kinase
LDIIQPTTGQFDAPDWARELPDFSFAKRIGSGGMGDVYLATSHASGRRFAAKVCHPKIEYEKAFLRELALWIDLPEHPNIAPCYFFRSVGSTVVVFAAFYEAGSLEDWIEPPHDDWIEQRRLANVSDALRVSLMMARGLALFHDIGFVHRDFKPRAAHDCR